MKSQSVLLAIVVLFGLCGCDFIGNSGDNDKTVALYMIKHFERVGNTCQIDESSVITANTPVVSYSDIISYDPSDYTFKLSSGAVKAIKELDHSVTGLPFAIKADNEIIYTGYFWPAYSSASCDWVIIDPIMIGDENKVKVQLGYPGGIEGQVIPDKRNDERLIEILKRDGKLID